MGNRVSVIPNNHSEQSSDRVSTICDEVSINTIKSRENHSVETKEESDDEFFETKEAEDEGASGSRNSEIEDFKKDLAAKRELRRSILAHRVSEMNNLKSDLESERRARKAAVSENSFLRNILIENSVSVPDNSTTPETGTSSVNDDLVNTISHMEESLETLKQQNRRLRIDLTETILTLQTANSDIVSLNKQSIDSTKHIGALKEVVAVSKKMLRIRESQLHELKEKLAEIEKTIGDKESCLLSESLRTEYERQLQNIRSLRSLYEERARVAEGTRLGLVKQLAEQRKEHAAELEKCSVLTAKVDELEMIVNDLKDAVSSTESQLAFSKAETKELKAEMIAINKLFTQMLMTNKRNPDLEKLSLRLEEHHELLTGLAGDEEGGVCSALPKLLLDLLNQLEESEDGASGETSTTEEEEESPGTSAEEIVGNLPKVWRVLIELLSHQAGPAAPNVDEKSTDVCYMSVQTPAGPRMVPSVSKTYIRLKDLIVEKMSLVKETGRMKQLNSHLEHRLQGQERRLCAVTSELSKTWHIASRLRRHHHQLHTHERILRYELQQKRKMLNEIKEELRQCREKWDEARQKNTDTEVQWKKLRTEFSSRKLKCPHDKVYNSPESGYSDERASEDESKEWNDESELVEDRLIRCRKKKLTDLQDSSTDFNLIAEGEDPISDMLDVTDLPLDSQDIEDSPEVSCGCDDQADGELADTEDISVSESESRMDLEQLIDSCNNIVCPGIETLPSSSCTNTNTHKNMMPSNTQNLKESTNINPNKTTDSTSENSTNNRLIDTDHYIMTDDVYEHNDGTPTDPDTSNLEQTENSINLVNPQEPSNDELENSMKLFTNQSEQAVSIQSTEAAPKKSSVDKTGHLSAVTSNLISEEELASEPILDNNDKNTFTDKSMTGTQPESSLTYPICSVGPSIEVSDIKACIAEPNEASTSSLSRGEEQKARWAARDERLKRLEEQTKNLVQKVNGTTNKSVKLQYKLEELHNIYGVENNASTSVDTENVSDDPSEENLEKNMPVDEEEQQN